MYLSTLLIDVGMNPDRPRPGRTWLRNRYRVHQRLSMGFPSETKKSDDAEFLEPFKPEQFGKEVHVPRAKDAGFLFRIDPKPGTGRVVIIVQSATKPDWEYAFQNADHLLAASPQVKSFHPRFEHHQQLMFRIFANPVRKVCRHSRDLAGNLFEERWYGKRVPVPTTDLDTWLEHRAEPYCLDKKTSGGKRSLPGFRLQNIMQIQAGYVYVSKTQNQGDGRRIRSALYDGILLVTDADHFRNTLYRGIGPSKAFGFGLLSVAPV